MTRAETAAPRVDGRLEESGRHRIVVVGGGAAGLELVTRLGDRLGRRGRASVTLVECARTHLWKPLLHAVAAGSIDPGECELSYLAQAHWHGFRYRLGEMTGLDRVRKEVHLGATFDDEGRQITPPRAVGYDTLVIAIGSVTNDFGTPGIAEHAVPLETPAQAERFNRRLVNACLRAQTQAEPVRPGQLHVAIVGGGATGTELAAELYRTTREVVSYGLDRIDPQRDIRIVFIEAAERLLPGLPERISHATRRLLEQPIASISSSSNGHRRPRATPPCSRSATAPPVRAQARRLRFRRGRRQRISRHRIWPARSSGGCTANRCSPIPTATSARWFRSAVTAPWAI
jgi:NADH dehydrogenase